MRTRTAILAAALAASTHSVFAAAFPLLTFEDVQSTMPLQVGTRYPGVEFSSNAWVISGGFQAGSGFDPQTRALRLAVDPTTLDTGSLTDFSMTFAGGFIDHVAFAASTFSGRGSLKVQLKDAAGGIIKINGVDDLYAVPESNACQTGPGVSFCSWVNVNFAFAGLARSITFSGRDQNVLLDNLNFTVPGSGNVVPEPAGLALTLSALAVVALVRQRTAKR